MNINVDKIENFVSVSAGVLYTQHNYITARPVCRAYQIVGVSHCFVLTFIECKRHSAGLVYGSPFWEKGEQINIPARSSAAAHMPFSSSSVRITPFHGGNASSNLVKGKRGGRLPHFFCCGWRSGGFLFQRLPQNA